MRRTAALLGYCAALLGVAAAFTRVFHAAMDRLHPPPGRFIEVEGLPLHVVDLDPANPRAVVCVHGLKGSHLEFTLSIADTLSRRYRVVAVDRAGSGYSDGRLSRGDPRDHARILHEELRLLGVSRPVMVGHSLGCSVLFAYAIAYPDDVAALVAVAPHALPVEHAIGGSARLCRLPVLGPLLEHTLVTPIGMAVGPSLIRMVAMPGRLPNEYARNSVRLAIRARAFSAAACDARDNDTGVRALLPSYGRIGCPVVIVTGGLDRLVSPGRGVELQAMLPTTELVEIPHTGHLPMFTAPDTVVEAVDRAWELAGG
jgi:pimeloyl-ACP methyl ester carboxylesterase